MFLNVDEGAISSTTSEGVMPVDQNMEARSNVEDYSGEGEVQSGDEGGQSDEEHGEEADDEDDGDDDDDDDDSSEENDGDNN